MTLAGKATPLLYTIGEKALRLEITDNKTAPVDLVSLESGGLTILFPHNRSFVRVMNGAAGKPPGAMPAPPSVPSAGAPMPTMPPIPAPPQRQPELKPTGKKEKILGFACEQFEITDRGETIEIWATHDLVPFQNYFRDATPPFGPRSLRGTMGRAIAREEIVPAPCRHARRNA